MADSSEQKDVETTVSNNFRGDQANVDENKPRQAKRGRAGLISSSTDNSDDSEPDEKRPAFRLQPPTLIHGKAKPVPKIDDSSAVASSSSKCKFLQPSKLSALTSSNSSTSVTKTDQQSSSAEPEPLVSSSNPFLMMTEKEQSEETNVTQNDQDNKEPAEVDVTQVNGTSAPDDAKPDSTTDTDGKDNEESSEDNLFSQAATGNAKNSSNDTGLKGFVFGSKMEDRVVMSNEKSPTSKDSGDGSAESTGGFVFGQNLSERVKVSSSTDSNPSFLPPTSDENNSVDSSTTAASESASQDTGADLSPSSSSNPDKNNSLGLKEAAAAHFRASQNRPKMPEIEVVTGEEEEKSVLQMQCKLHQFDAVNQNWLERGVGSLHLNDGKYTDDNLHFQSRLVMRVHGSLRLVLNTKVWPMMTVEKASKKSVRVSAQTDDGSIGVFLITGTINDAEQIFRALEYRVLHQKQLEEKRQELERQKAPSDRVPDNTCKDENGEVENVQEKELRGDQDKSPVPKEEQAEPVSDKSPAPAEEKKDQDAEAKLDKVGSNDSGRVTTDAPH